MRPNYSKDVFKRKKDWKPLEERTYRHKVSALQFFCPLCRTERAITTNHRLSVLNYSQIGLLTGLCSYLLWPLFGVKSLCVFFPLLVAFEATRRLLFSKEVPCPHCGFDASWYKRDVKVARKRVEEFWQAKEAQSKTPIIPPQSSNQESFQENF